MRADDPELFGPNGRVDADRIFPRTNSYTPGLHVLVGGQVLNPLYAKFEALLAKPDALDPDSDTGRRLAEVEAKIAKHEQVDVDRMTQAFQRSLHMPIDAGAKLIAEIDKAIAEVTARASTASTADDASSADTDAHNQRVSSEDSHARPRADSPAVDS